jgi:hypothetical protein
MSRWRWALLAWTALLTGWFVWLVFASPLNGDPLAAAMVVGTVILWFVGLAILALARVRSSR